MHHSDKFIRVINLISAITWVCDDRRSLRLARNPTVDGKTYVLY